MATRGTGARIRAALRGRWRRWLTICLVETLALSIGVTTAVLAYASSVPLPPEPSPPQASVLYYRDGQTELARVGIHNRTDVSLDRVPEAVRHAVLAAEDRGFYGHSGISVRGVLRAVWANVFEGAAGGASTITQQYARNAHLTQERTARRKAREAVLAVKIERKYSKDEILERYLNTIYFGRGAYGVGAAAQAFFGTTVDRLTATQGAVLAAAVKDPYNFDPGVDPEAARQRWRWILDAMVEQGWLDRDAARAARYPAVAEDSPTSAALSGPLGLIVDRVERELADRGIPPQTLRTAGLRVVTTIDRRVQAAALEQVGAALRGQPAHLRAALVAVDPTSGAVRGYYGGDRGRGYFDDALAPRAPGATFKPFVLTAALRQGIAYRSRWNGASPRIFADRHGVPLHNRNDDQCPVCPLDEAMVRSLNTPYYAVAEKIGPAGVRRTAVALGIPNSYDGRTSLVDEAGAPDPGRTRAEISLGRYPVSPADLATAYASLAGDGVRSERHVVAAVTRRDGTRWYAAAPRRTRVVPAAVAADVTTVLAQVAADRAPVPGRPVAAMPGTVQYGDTADPQDAWMAGYAPQLAAVVWIGRAEPGPLRDRAGAPVRGEGLPATLWRRFVTAALSGDPAVPLPEPAHVGDPDAGDAEGPAHVGDADAGDAEGPAPVEKPPYPENAAPTRARPTPPPADRGPERSN